LPRSNRITNYPGIFALVQERIFPTGITFNFWEEYQSELGVVEKEVAMAEVYSPPVIN